jgi:hypothetical protein
MNSTPERNILDDYLVYVVRVTVPAFGSTFHKEYVNNLSTYGKGTEIFREVGHGKNKKKEQYSTTLEFRFTQPYQRNQFVSALTNTFRAGFLTIEERQARQFPDKVALLKHLIDTHDWYYAFSDDHRVWSAGEAASKRISQLLEELKETNPEVKQYYEEKKPKN